MSNQNGLMLASTLDVAAAMPLATELLALRGRLLSVNASQVQRLGAQCAQVLLAAHSTWSGDDIPLSFVDPSPAFRESLTIPGLGEAFELNG